MAGSSTLCSWLKGFSVARALDEDSDVDDWWLKSLDPVYMMVRRDAYGNVFGYIQLLTFPPVTFEAQDIIHFKWCPKSWWYEYS